MSELAMEVGPWLPGALALLLLGGRWIMGLIQGRNGSAGQASAEARGVSVQVGGGGPSPTQACSLEVERALTRMSAAVERLAEEGREDRRATSEAHSRGEQIMARLAATQEAQARTMERLRDVSVAIRARQEIGRELKGGLAADDSGG